MKNLSKDMNLTNRLDKSYSSVNFACGKIALLHYTAGIGVF